MRDGTYWVHSVGLCCGRQRSKHWLPTEDCLSIQQGRYSCLKLCLFMVAITCRDTCVLLISAVYACVCVRSFCINILFLEYEITYQIFTINTKVSVDQSPGAMVVLPSSQTMSVMLDHLLSSADFKVLTKESFVYASI